MATHEQNQAPSFLPPTFAKGQSCHSTAYPIATASESLENETGYQADKGELSFLPTPPAAASP